MDPLLWVLKASGLGLSVNNFYAGGFLHADDIRTLAASTNSLEAQVPIVKDFANENFLKLNIQNVRLCFLAAHVLMVNPEVNGSLIPVNDVEKCLGFVVEERPYV